jgi:CubicO group peptidase (beta-lactamase class C family)
LNVLLILTAILAASAWGADQGTFPGREWTVVESPESVGWSGEKLDQAESYAGTIDTAAVMVVHHGVVVRQWGGVDRSYPCHSMRKGLLSGLIGIYVDEGILNLSRTLAELGIDDNPPLNDAERAATVADLITARSGVYHLSAYSPDSMIEYMPQRGSHAPGTYWFYNNWDFNALGTIFRQETGKDIYEEFERQFAEPLGMQDYRIELQHYLLEDVSIHPAYTFRMSARDLARFGLLYARGGNWNGRQIVPEQWVRESVRPHSQGPEGGYGYMWWTTRDDSDELFGIHTEPGAFAASGSNGHRVFILPKADIVIVHRVNTSLGNKAVSETEIKTLVDLILSAAPRSQR